MAVPQIFAKLGEAMAKLSDRVLEFVSADKSAEVINKQIDPQMEVYRQMMAEISAAEDISTEKKVELLNNIALNIDEQQYHANEKLEKRQKDAADVALKVLGAIFTAGISLTPELIRRLKAANPQIEAQEIDELLEESFTDEPSEENVIDEPQYEQVIEEPAYRFDENDPFPDEDNLVDPEVLEEEKKLEGE